MKNKVNTEIGEKLINAINTKKNDIKSMVWKYQDGAESKFIDMTQEELQKCYDHCLSMLYNKGRSAPGKHEVKKNIERLYVNCNAELFMRYLMHDLDIEFLKTRKGIIDHLNNAKRDLGLTLESTIDNVFNNVPPVFKTLTINNVLDACLDKLDVLNKKLISDKFILDQGVWLTKKERKEFTEYDEEGNKRNFIEVMKERLFIDGVYIKTSPRGFSYNEFRLLIELPEFPKISSLSTDVLKLLRNKVILLVDNDNNRQIDRWTNIKDNIKKVADYKEFRLVNAH